MTDRGILTKLVKCTRHKSQCGGNYNPHTLDLEINSIMGSEESSGPQPPGGTEKNQGPWGTSVAGLSVQLSEDGEVS